MALQIEERIPLAQFTTMRVGGNARFFAQVENVAELTEALNFADYKKLSILILGGGSNMLISDSGFSGLVIKIEFKGISFDGERVVLSAGVVWDDVVRGAVARGLWGIENLSLVPGSAGGAIVQNIGAYGVEVKDMIFSVDVFNRETMQVETFFNNECEFAYRESIFKKNKKYIVISVTLRLIKNGNPQIDYEDVKKYFTSMKVDSPTLAEIRDAIVTIRTQKMPALPLGTAGSFFKNPVVGSEQYDSLKARYPEIKAYIQGDNTVKLSAAWLIDHIGGFRGSRRDNVGVNERQALVLVNYGNASAEEILSLAEEIKNSISKKINVLLEEEVVIV